MVLGGFVSLVNGKYYIEHGGHGCVGTLNILSFLVSKCLARNCAQVFLQIAFCRIDHFDIYTYISTYT